MTDFTVGGVMGGTYFHEWDDNYKYSLEEVKEKIKYIEDMKKECRIKEINEQIKRLKKEKNMLKCESKYLDFSKSDIEVDGFPVLMGINDLGKYANASFWLSTNYDWELLPCSEDGIILVPTKK